MKIIYLGPFRLPNGDAAAARVLNVAKTLRLAGHEVSFISWGGKQRDEDCGKDGVFRIDGFSYVVTNELDPQGSIINKIKCKLTRGIKTKRLLKERLGSFNVIIMYNCSLTRWLLSFTEKHHIKLINDITEWYDYSELKVTDRLSYAYNMFCIQKRVKNKIVISSFLDKFYKTTHNIIVPATCDISEAKWRSGNSIAQNRVGIFEGITLIYAGNPARKDAVHYIIGAVQRLANEGEKIRMLILGAEREGYIERYGDLLPNQELSERIMFLGKVSQDDVPAFYALADFMVLLRESSRKSNAGFPTKFSESFASGTPVIANLTSDLGVFLRDGETGFVVDEPSEDAIYRTLKQKVLPLDQTEIEIMKSSVRVAAKQLDYHAYVEPLRDFMNKLV